MIRHTLFRRIGLVAAVLVCVLVTLPALAAVYPVDEPASPRVQLRFVADDITLGTQIVRAGDTIEPPDAPTARQEGTTFYNWSVGTLDLSARLDGPLTVSDIQDIIAASGSSADANNLYDVAADAVFGEAFLVRFHQYPYAQSKADPAKDGVYAFSEYTSYDAASLSHVYDVTRVSEEFVPLNEMGDVELVAWERYASDAPADAAPTASYTTTQTISGITSALDVYPKLSLGFWVGFDTGFDGILPSVFVQNAGDDTGVLSYDLLPTEQSLAGSSYDPETHQYAEGYRGWRLGYELEGWYEDPELTTKVTGDITIRGDKSLYARWLPRNDTPYTVMHMVEDEAGLPGKGNFTSFGTVQCVGTTDAPAEAVETGGPLATRYHRATQEETAANAALSEGAQGTVRGDGSTVIRVYWPRNVYKYVFKDTDNKTTIHSTGWVKWGQDQATWSSDRLRNSTYSTSTYAYSYERKTSTGNSWWQNNGPAPYPNGVTGGGVTVTYKRYRETYSCTRWNRDYENLLPGEEPVNETKVMTFGGVTYTFELKNPDGAFRTGYTGSAVSTVPRTATNEPRWTIGIVGMGSTRYTTSTRDLSSATEYSSYGTEGYIENDIYCVDVYSIRNPFELSFANVDGVVGSYGSTASRNVTYRAPLASCDPGYTAETLRNVGGQYMRFAGWYTDEFSSHHPEDPASAPYAIDLASATMPGAATTLYAAWIDNTYDVTFDACGGTFAPTGAGELVEDGAKLVLHDVPSGTLISRPDDPTRTVGSVEYTFSGWYKDPDYRQPCNFYTDIVSGSDVTLYAKWVKGGFYSVAYHKADGTQIEGVDPTIYHYGATVTVASQQDDPAQTKPFLGWSRVRDNASRIVGQTFVISSNTDLFAVYGDAMPDALPTDVEDGAPVVTLVSNYESLPEGVEALTDEVSTTLQATRANASVVMPSQLTATVAGAPVTAAVRAYRLAGWSTEPGGAATYSLGEPVAVASDTTLYAHWEPKRLDIEAIAGTHTYNGAAQNVAPALRDASETTLLVRDVDYTLSWESNVHAGTATVTATGKGEYVFAEPVSTQFQIAPAPVALIAEDKSTPFGDPPAELSWRVGSGTIFGSDDLGVTLSCDVTRETAAGAYTIGITATGNADYDVTLTGGTYTVVPSSDVAVSVQGYSGTYDGTAHGIRVTADPRGATTATVYYAKTELTADNYATVGTTDPADARATVTHAGTTTVWWWLVATGDQEASKGGSATVTIERAPLAGRANDVSDVTYGDAAHDGGMSWSGFVGDDTTSALDLTGLTYAFNARADGLGAAYEQGSAAGSYYVIPSGATASDYEITFEPGTLTVGRREVGIVWSEANPTYTGAVRHYAGATLTGLVPADAGRVSIGGYAGSMSATDVGSYGVSVSSLAGDASRNYALGENSHAWSVLQASNSATVAIDGWTYGGAKNDPVVTSGFGTDTANITWSTSPDGPFVEELPVEAGGAYPSAGTYYVRAEIPATANWGEATSPATRLTIARRPLSLVVTDAAVTFGDDVPDYTATWSGFAPGESEADAHAVTGEVAFECAYAKGSHVGTYEIKPTGVTASDNYELTITPATLTVTQAENEWTVAPSVESKTYDGSPVEVTVPVAAFGGTGEPAVQFAQAGTSTWSPEVPVHAGSYVMRASVGTTDDYTGLLEELPFEINRATWPDISAGDVTVGESTVRRTVTAGSTTPEDLHLGTLTISGHDGSVPAEYSIDGGSSWLPVPATGVVTGLAAGDVLVRHSADADHIESASTSVEVLYGVEGSIAWSYAYLYPQKDPTTGQTTMVSGTVNDTGTERSRAANLYLYNAGAVVEGFPVAISSTPEGDDAATGSYELHGLSSHNTYSLELKPTVDESPDSTVQVESASYAATQAGDGFTVAFTPSTGFFDGVWEIKLSSADTDGHTAVQALYVKVLWAPADDSADAEYAVVSQQATGSGARCAVTGEGSSREATGLLPVWLYNSTGIPSRYRAVVVGVVVDGQEFPVTQEFMSAGAPSPMHWDDGVGGPVNAPMTIDVSDLHVPMVGLDANGGTAPVAGTYLLGVESGSSYMVGASAISAREPSWENHRFEGWYWDGSPTSTNQLAGDVTGLSQKATLYAHWSEDQAAPAGLVASHPTPVTEGADGNVVRDGSGVPITNADAEIAGVSDGMEWRVQATDGTWPDTWTPVPVGATSLGGLAVGTYQVRMAAVAATADAWAKNVSEPSTVEVTAKGVASAPTAPVIASSDATSFAVEAVPGQEYSIDGGITWVTPAEGATTITFDGLVPGTAHSVVTRAAETDDLYHSDVSTQTTLTLPKLDIVPTRMPGALTSHYDGQEHALVDPISDLPEGCVRIEYGVNTPSWQTAPPVAIETSYYYIYLHFVGDETHNDLVVEDPLECAILQADNVWTVEPAMDSWLAGLTPSTPRAEARFGEVSIDYCQAALGGQDISGDPEFFSEVPTTPGSYLMRARVQEDLNWTGLESLVPFEVWADTLSYDSASLLSTGSTPAGEGSVGQGIEVAECGFLWKSHLFLGWNTKRDGSGTSYAPGDTFTLTAGEDVLYAQWDPRGELAYDGNGAPTGSTAPQPGRADATVTVRECGFSFAGYDFVGWNTAADGRGRAYAPGDSYTLSLGGDVLYAQWKQRVVPVSAQPMYRLYNPNSGEHFYTASVDERNAVVAAGWNYEGIGWVAPLQKGAPVYRLYNANAGDHHYTMDAGERDALVVVGWRYEGVGWLSDLDCGVSIWRQYNPNALAGAHNFTPSEAEHAYLCRIGWRGEGVAWYGVR